MEENTVQVNNKTFDLSLHEKSFNVKKNLCRCKAAEWSIK
jgi:hypothetical protein